MTLMIMLCNMAMYSNFGKNHLLTSVNPNDPKSKDELMFVVEEVKLVNMYAFHEHAKKSVKVAAF